MDSAAVRQSRMAGTDAARRPARPLLERPVRAAWENVFVAHRAITREVERRLQDRAAAPPLVRRAQHAGQDEAGRMKQTAFAARVQVSPSGLSRLLDRMVARGVVRRREVPGDRRATELVVTDDGDELIGRIWDLYGGVLDATSARRRRSRTGDGPGVRRRPIRCGEPARCGSPRPRRPARRRRPARPRPPVSDDGFLDPETYALMQRSVPIATVDLLCLFAVRREAPLLLIERDDGHGSRGC